MGIKKIQQMKENTKELNLLVVEDNEVFQNFYKKLLEKYFKNHYTAMDGLEGLKLYQENPHQYDIIIADHQMPRMDGLEMITQMKKINPDAHIIFITGTSEIEILTEVTFMSIDAIISKPVNKIQLLSKIDDIAAKIVDKRHMQLYVEQLEQMNQAIWVFKDKMRKKIRMLEYIPEAKSIFIELEGLLNKPVSLMSHDSDDEETVELRVSESDEDFDVIKAMQEYNASHQETESVAVESQTMHQVAEHVQEHEGRFQDIRYSVVDKISAVDFVAEVDEQTFSELDEFKEGLDNFNLLLNDMSMCDVMQFYGYIDQVVEFYNTLYNVIKNFIVFPAIENTFHEFSNFLENISLEQLEEQEKRDILIDALFALSDDLLKWINIVFYERNTDNIHYFDASFANTCLEIESMFAAQEAEAAEDDEELLEFF